MATLGGVKFLSTTAAKWATLTPEAGSFYVVDNTALSKANDVYLGSTKLSGAADMAAAIERIAANEGDIDDLQAIVAGIGGQGDTYATVVAAINGAIAALDGTATIASVADGVVTLKTGITEADGVVSNDSGTDITLAKVATTGTAADVAIVDAGSLLTATDVESAIAELAQASSGGVASKTIYLQDESAGQSDYAKVYKIYQGSNTSDMTQNTLVGTMNIPKDMVVQSGSIGTVTTADVPYTGAKVGDKYIELVLQNVTDPLYIPANDLVDIYTGGATAEVSVSISDGNVITASIVEISGTKLTDGTVAKAKLSTAVQNSLDKADSAVQSVTSGTTNGTIAVDGTDVAVHGLGSAAYEASTAFDAAGSAAAVSQALTNALTWTEVASE